MDSESQIAFSSYSESLKQCQPFALLLVCGEDARQNYKMSDAGRARIIEMTCFAGSNWTKKGLDFVKRMIQEGKADLEIVNENGKIRANRLVPF